MRSEQRIHNRFTPKANAFAALGRKYTKVGKIKDISIDGLAFEYIAGEGFNQDESHLDIFLVGTEFHLYRVPCRVIYNIDIYVPKINNSLIEMYTTKRCGVQFKELSKDVKLLLDFFLKYHTK
jgi:hypothetical protein